jgi:hypothetical protein
VPADAPAAARGPAAANAVAPAAALAAAPSATPAAALEATPAAPTTSAPTPAAPANSMGLVTDGVREPCPQLDTCPCDADDPTNSMGLVTDGVREPCPQLDPEFQRVAASPQQGTPPFGGSAGRPRGRSPGLRRARIRPPAPEVDGGIGSTATHVLDYLRGLGDVGVCRRSLMKLSRSSLVLLANHLDGMSAIDLAAGDGFYKQFSKRTLAIRIFGKLGLAEPLSEGVFPLGNASST